MNHALVHPDPQERMAAVRAVVASVEPSALLAHLAQNLADPHREVRALVADALAHACVAEPEVLTGVANVASAIEVAGPQALRSRVAALHTLQKAGLLGVEEGEALAQARAACASALEHESGHVRFQAMSALRRLGIGDSHREAVRKSLTDGDREVVSLAAEVLALAGDGDASAQLAQAAASLRGEARIRAVLAMAQLAVAGADDSHPELAEELVAMTRSIPHGLSAIDLLVELDPTAAVPALDRASKGWLVHRLLRVAACAGLARLGKDSGLVGLREWVQSRHDDARGFAIEKLGALGEDLDALAAIATDRNDYHSDTAVLALAAHAERYRETLLAAGQDPRPEVRLEAARALRDHAWAAQALAKLAQDDDSEVRLAASGED